MTESAGEAIGRELKQNILSMEHDYDVQLAYEVLWACCLVSRDCAMGKCVAE
jgi:hypothetical protein